MKQFILLLSLGLMSLTSFAYQTKNYNNSKSLRSLNQALKHIVPSQSQTEKSDILVGYAGADILSINALHHQLV